MQLALIRFDAIFLQQIPQLPTIVPRDEVYDCLRLIAEVSMVQGSRLLCLSGLMILCSVYMVDAQQQMGSRGQSAHHASGSVATLSAQDVFKLVSPSVFIVESLDVNGAVITMGSGVAVSSDAVVTNDHVISDGKAWRVRQGEKSWSASVTHDDAAHDICRLHVAGLKVRPVSLRRIANIEIGERVYAVGSPAGLEISMSEGIVSGIRNLPEGDMIQMTAAISKGSSGGGLFDSSGRLIGLTTSYVEGGQSLNFALPADLVSTLDSHPANSASMAHDRGPAFQAGVWIFYGLELVKKHAAEGAMDQKTAIDAFVAFIRAGQLEPDWPEPFVGIGLVDDALGEHKAAAIAYENAVKRKPDDAVIWYSLGLQYQELGEYEKAIAAHKTAIALKPDDCNAWGRLAAIYLLIQDKRREGIEAYMKVKTLAPVQGSSCQQYEQTLRPLVVP